MTESLEQLLADAASDPAARPAFTAALLASDVLVLGATEDDRAKLVTWSDSEGSLIPFFTSEEMLRAPLAAHNELDSSYLRLPCRSLFEMTRGARLVLNPDGPQGKLFLVEEIEALMSGVEPGVTTEVLSAERQVLIGSPAYTPPDLPIVLARYFAQRPAVEAAHLGWIAHPDGHSGYLVVVVTNDAAAAMDGFGSLQIGEVSEGTSVEVI